jgi:hypothetical protein
VVELLPSKYEALSSNLRTTQNNNNQNPEQNKNKKQKANFLHREQEMLLPFSPSSSYFFPIMLDSFPNKLYYWFYYQKEINFTNQKTTLFIYLIYFYLFIVLGGCTLWHL